MANEEVKYFFIAQSIFRGLPIPSEALLKTIDELQPSRAKEILETSMKIANVDGGLKGILSTISVMENKPPESIASYLRNREKVQ